MLVPSLTKRHFEFIATIIRATAHDMAMPDSEIERIALHFAHHLRGTNANFNADKFVEACKPLPSR